MQSLADCRTDTIVKNVAGLLVHLLASWPAEMLEPVWLEMVAGACKIIASRKYDRFHTCCHFLKNDFEVKKFDFQKRISVCTCMHLTTHLT